MELANQWLMHVVLPGLGAVLLLVVIGLARNYAGQQRDERLRQIILRLVEAAEQLYGPGKGETKRRYVRDKLKVKGLQHLTREDMEAAVYDLKQQAKGDKPRLSPNAN
mgnify:FL=1